MLYPLLSPNVLICSVGSEILYLDPLSGKYTPDHNWEEHLDEGGAWDRQKVADIVEKIPHLTMQVRRAVDAHLLGHAWGFHYTGITWMHIACQVLGAEVRAHAVHKS